MATLFSSRKNSDAARPRLTPQGLHTRVKRYLGIKYDEHPPEIIKVSGDTLSCQQAETRYHELGRTNRTDLVEMIKYPRQHGSIILSSAANDFLPTDFTETRAQIRDALTCYAVLRDENKINPQTDVVCIPLCQIAADRRHFVLIALMNHKLILIDAKRYALTYPLSDFMQALTSLANEPLFHLQVLPVRQMDHQTMLNDTYCGHYVMSYILQLAQLTQTNNDLDNMIFTNNFLQDDYHVITDGNEDDLITGFVVVDDGAIEARQHQLACNADTNSANVISTDNELTGFISDELDLPKPPSSPR